MKYDLQSELDSIYSLFPEGKCRPVIGITANFNDGDTTLNKPYYAQVVAAGGVPMLIPPVADRDVLISTLDRIDGLLLSGGADINPLWAGEEPSPNLNHINAERDLPELLLTQLAYNRQIPILGICRGIQTLAVALGGKVIQDLEERGKPTGRRTEFGNERKENSIEWSVDAYLEETQRLRAAIGGIDGMEALPTATSFFLVRLEEPSAGALKQWLAGEGILIRDASNFEGLDGHYIRIAAQRPEENDLLIEKLKEWSMR